MKTWSCKDLQHSAFLSHSSIKACCKRFFVDGERRGDVVLIDGINEQPTAESIRDAKLELLDAINAGEETSCSGCPWLEFKEWPKVTEAVEYLSLEHHSICNMRCTYCSDVYYGGQKPSYNVQKLVSELALGVKTVVWGGGEPTLGPEFSPLSRNLALSGAWQRILSNSIIYNIDVHHLLNDGKAELVTSIDAGTPALFKKIRGVDKMFEVLNTLSNYAQKRPDLITIKYILTDENCSPHELKEFTEHIRIEGLQRCNFQISCDFRQDVATMDELRAVVELHALLLGIGAECVFIDDLCRIRIAPLLKELAKDLRVQRHLPPDIPAINTFMGIRVASAHNTPHVIVWGNGEQSKRLIEDSLFFREVTPTVVDSATYDVLMDRGDPIVIAASQAYPTIFRELKQRGLSHRVIKELVI